MIRIAIVEDEIKSVELLKEYIARYGKMHGETFNIATFNNGLDFIDGYTANYDVVFMDIMMPHMNGMDAAIKFRELDKTTCLVFVTNMTQYAIDGYNVGALDFMIKPIAYFDFAMKLEKAIYFSRRNSRDICITTEMGMSRVSFSDIKYVQSEKHYIYFHTTDGILKKRASLNDAEVMLDGGGFARCSHSFLINLEHVTKIHGNEVTVSGEIIGISRSKKEEFMNKLTTYLGRSII